MRVRFLALISGFRIWRCCELWCSLQTLLGSSVAVAAVQASGYSSDLTPSLETSKCCGCSPRKRQKKKPHKNQKPYWNRAGPPGHQPFCVPHFSFLGNKLQPPQPSLSFNGQIQTVANQGREGKQRAGRSRPETIVQPWGRVLVPPPRNI